MIEPTLALQTAIRAALIASPAVTDHVAPDLIRSGSTRPGNMPCIVMSGGSTALRGDGYRSQRLAEVFLDLHVWTQGDGEDRAKEIAFAVQSALAGGVVIEGGSVEAFRITRAVYSRDPDPTFGHGILSVEALVRWIV